MTEIDVAMLLGLLGVTILLSAWLGRRTGDAPRDVWLMTGLGGILAACAGALAVGGV